MIRVRVRPPFNYIAAGFMAIAVAGWGMQLLAVVRHLGELLAAGGFVLAWLVILLGMIARRLGRDGEQQPD